MASARGRAAGEALDVRQNHQRVGGSRMTTNETAKAMARVEHSVEKLARGASEAASRSFVSADRIRESLHLVSGQMRGVESAIGMLASILHEAPGAPGIRA